MAAAPRWRGTTLFKELAVAGVQTAVASDNTRDPFYAYGDLDPVEVLREAVRILHLDHPLDTAARVVTTTPAAILGRPELVQSRLRHIRKLGAVLTYGATPFRAWVAGNPPKKIVKRVIRAQIRIGAPVTFLAHYNMNQSTQETRARFLEKVGATMQQF